MAKGNPPTAKPEVKKPAETPEKAEGPKKGHQPSPQQNASKAGAPPTAPIHCAAEGCKKPDKRFSFCDEHYDQFKFGLIKKSGQPVPDYEKKIEHYEAYKARQTSARKAA